MQRLSHRQPKDSNLTKHLDNVHMIPSFEGVKLEQELHQQNITYSIADIKGSQMVDLFFQL